MELHHHAPFVIVTLISCGRYRRTSVLRIAHLFHPQNGTAIDSLLNRNMCHCRRWGRAMPVLYLRWNSHDVPGPYLFNRPSPCLRSPVPGLHNRNEAEICVSGKSHRQTLLPLTQEIGDAIAEYIN